MTENTGVIVGALSFRNPYDGNTLNEVIKQYESIFGKAPRHLTVDRGYRGKKQIGETEIHSPKPFNDKTLNKHQQRKLRKRFRRRAGIEPVIGHLKTDYRLGRNFYKGIIGDEINVLLAAAAYNCKRMMNKWRESIFDFFQNLFFHLLFSKKILFGDLKQGF